MLKKISIIILVLLFVVSIFSCNSKDKKNSSTKGKSDKTQEQFVEVILSKFSRNIDISGYLEPADIQNVQFRGTGAITGVYVKEGDRVKKGDLLATIDDTSQRYNIAKVSQELEKARLVGNKKEIELLEMQMKIAENNLVYTRATANFDGVVIEVNIAEGDYAEAGTTLNLIKLVNVDTLEANVEIDEIDVIHLYEGQKLYLDFDSLPGVKIEGKISYIPFLGTYNTSSGIGVKKVKITVDNPPSELSPGFSFSSTIKTDSNAEYIIIPNSAIKSSRGKSYVVKLVDGGRKQVEVTTRYLGEGLSQLISGDVKPGDKLVGNSSRSLMEKMGSGSGGGQPQGQGGPGGGRF